MGQFIVDWSRSDYDTAGIMCIGTDVSAFTINWGDGSPNQILHGDEAFPGSGLYLAEAPHAYAADGTYVIIVNDRPNDPAIPPVKLKAYMYSGVTADLTITGTGMMDMILSGIGNDMLKGGAGDDWISGDGGNDTIIGGDGRDMLFGDLGNDLLRGGNGDDFIAGGEGNDRLYGGGDSDVLNGGAGDDLLYGDDGSDTLDGGAGADRLTGGAGGDYFRFEAPSGPSAPAALSERDIVMDFSSVDDDFIDVQSFAAAAGVDQLAFRDYGELFGGSAGELRLVAKASGDTLVQIDIDGDKHVDFDFLVKDTISLRETDFFL
jgi:Ca2+-binding RTX toxin-like protein